MADIRENRRTMTLFPAFGVCFVPRPTLHPRAFFTRPIAMGLNAAERGRVSERANELGIELGMHL